jgi:hypothetical protein
MTAPARSRARKPATAQRRPTAPGADARPAAQAEAVKPASPTAVRKRRPRFVL